MDRVRGAVHGSLDAINKSERIKEDNTIQNDKLANIDTRHDVVEYDKQEIKDLQKLCAVSNVAIWLDRVGLGRLLQVFEESKKAQHSRGGWIRKAVEEEWNLSSRYSREHLSTKEFRPYHVDSNESTRRAAQLAGIDLDN